MTKMIDKAIRILVLLTLIILVVSVATGFMQEHFHR